MQARLQHRLTTFISAAIVAMCCSATAAWSYDVELSWSPVSGVSGYKVYVRENGQSFGAGTDVGTPAPNGSGQIVALAADLSGGVAYFFAVTAYDASLAESGLSNELSLIMGPTPAPTFTATPGSGATWTPTSVPPTATRTATAQSGNPTPTQTSAFGCSAGGGSLTCSQTGDAWTLEESIGQRIDNAGPLSVCRVTAQMYRIGSPTGTMHAELWSDAGTAPGGTQIGGDSDVSDIAPAALTASTSGQTVSFTWSSNQPVPTGVFWLKIVPNTSGGQVAWVSGPASGPGSACAGGTGFNGWWVKGDFAQDFYYTLFVGDAAAPTATATSSWTPTASATPSATATFTLPPPPPTATWTPSPIPTFTATATPTRTATWTSTASFTATFTHTFTPPATATHTASPSPTATRTATATNTFVPTSSATATRTNTPLPTSSATATRTNTPLPTSSATAKRTATSTAIPTSTNTVPPTSSATATRTASFTRTATASTTRTSTLLPTNTQTPARSATAIATATFTATHSFSPTPTNTIPPTGTATRTHTATRTVTAANTATNTIPPTSTATPPYTATRTATAANTATNTIPPTSTATPPYTATRTATATITPTDTLPPTATWSATHSASPSATATWTETNTPIPPTDAATGTATPTGSPTWTPDPDSTSTATAPPTATPTHTWTATESPIPTSTNPPTETQTAEPSSTASATPENTETWTETPTVSVPPTVDDTNTPAPSATASPMTTPTATEIATQSVTPTVTPSFSPTPTATFIPDWDVSIAADASVMAGSSIDIPVRIAAGSGLRAFALTIHFDPSVVEVDHVALSAAAKPGTLTSTNLIPGELSLVGLLVQPMQIGGTLLDVTFNAVGECAASSALQITSCLLDSGAIGCAPSDGDVTVDCGVGGKIRHWRSRAPVGETSVALVGSQSSTMAMTDDLGQFTFGETDQGTWELRPQKRGGTGGAVSALDGALVLRAVAGGGQLDSVQRLACDVTGNGHVSALDASRILQVAVGQVASVPIANVCDSDWAFVPEPTALPNQRLVQPELGSNSCRPGGIVFDPLLGDAPQQDFIAVLFGDCTGNWSDAHSSNSTRVGREGHAHLGTPHRVSGGRWAVPLFISSPEPFLALDVRVGFDGPARPVGVQPAGAGRDAMLRYDSDGHSVLTIALASANTLTSDTGPVAVLMFESPTRRNGTRLARLLSVSIDEVDVGIGN